MQKLYEFCINPRFFLFYVEEASLHDMIMEGLSDILIEPTFSSILDDAFKQRHRIFFEEEKKKNKAESNLY